VPGGPGHDVDESTAARLWVIEVVTTHRASGGTPRVHHFRYPRFRRTAIYSKWRWLLSEHAGRDNRHQQGPSRASFEQT